MSFDLKAASRAALTEAQRAPFEFTYEGETFVLTNVNEWPIEVQAGFLELNEAENQDDPANARKALSLIASIVGLADWDRFQRVVPMSAVPVLIEEMSKQMVGGAAEGSAPLSKRSPRASTRT